MDCSPPGSSVHGDSPGKNTGVACHALLQGIFPTPGWNPGLLNYWWILYHLSHQEACQLTNTAYHVFFKLCFHSISVSSTVKNLPEMQEMQRHGFDPWVGEIPQRRAWQHTAVILTGWFHGGLKSVGHDWRSKQWQQQICFHPFILNPLAFIFDVSSEFFIFSLYLILFFFFLLKGPSVSLK